VIREILKLTQSRTITSFAGGLPSPATFPVGQLRAAFDAELAEQANAALQYSTTEGDPGLRQWLAAVETARGTPTDPDQVLITGGSQQGLDLVAKALIDPGARVLVEAPTYLGALQAFAQYAPSIEDVAADDQGLDPDALDAALRTPAVAGRPRFLYLLPNFQNPTGRTLSAPRRTKIADLARRHDLWLVEDDPYGDLWYDAPPPAPLRDAAPERTIRLGSFSKIIAPGLRLGYVIAPRAMIDALVRLKQASDLHTATLTQRVVLRLVAGGLLQQHLPAVRARYRDHCAAMLAALAASFPAAARWTRPAGGMFVWVELPQAIDAAAMLAQAVAAGVAYVPGAAFYATQPRVNTLRLSFVTVAPAQIHDGIARLGRVVHAALEHGG
jgi:2-aminoadipate transaminase